MAEIGCIADDFTGATDIAGALTRAGYRTVVTIGAPPDGLPEADAIVVALKTRTSAVEHAVTTSTDAARRLLELGCTRLYFKYCSTFDSTPSGNIGPVADALLETTGHRLGVVVPSFPRNGRRVFQSQLFVHDQLLSESPMRHHPLTPMTDSHIGRLLTPQTRSRVELVDLQTVRDADALSRRLSDLAESPSPVLAVLDAIDDGDLTRIAAALPDTALLTGGAALAGALPAPAEPVDADPLSAPVGRRLVLAGSASSATRGQIAAALPEMPSAQLDLAALAADAGAETQRLRAVIRDAWAEAPDRPVLVFATASLDDLSPADSREQDAERIEACLSALAVAAVDDGARSIIVAGGESSGAVTSALGVQRLEIGPEIAPGVVWSRAVTAGGVEIGLALKSGNFGSERIFLDAWAVFS